MYIPIGPEIPLIGIFPTYTPKVYQHFYKNSYSPVIFVIAKQTNKQMKKHGNI